MILKNNKKIQNKIMWGEWEKILNYFSIDSGCIVIDVGACVGDMTIAAAKRAKKVISIEPEPKNVNLLQENVKKNNLNNVYVIESVAWCSQKKLQLYINKFDRGGHSVVIKDPNRKKIEVQADTLDNIIDRFGLKKIDLLKINVEGAEVEVFQGMKKSLPLVENIIVDTHSLVEGNTLEKVRQILKENGFVCKIEINSKDSDNIGILAERGGR